MQAIRQQGLESLTRRYLSSAAQLGCAPPEIARMVNQMLEQWQQSGELPKPESTES
jgi:hypothetical protein